MIVDLLRKNKILTEKHYFYTNRGRREDVNLRYNSSYFNIIILLKTDYT